MLKFNEEKHEYTFNGAVVPSVTQILKAGGVCPDFSMIRQDVLERKRHIGVNIHKAIELYNRGTLDASSIKGELSGYFDGFLLFRKEHDYTTLMSEMRMHHKVYGYAGTPDDYGLLDGHKSVLDTKCVYTLGDSVGPQTAAYKQLLGHNGFPSKKRYALQLKPDGTYNLIEYKSREDIQVFNSALTLFNWRSNHGKIAA